MTATPKPLAAAALAVLLAACASKPAINADLEAARTALQQARANPYAARAASVDLERAQQSLARAEAAWNNTKDADETRQRAYVARRQAEVALALATQAENDERVAKSGTEQERLRAEARTREAERAVQQARVAQGSAATAQQDAEAARQRAAQESQRAAQESQRAAALQRDLQDLRAKNTDRGMVVTLGDVLFATGKATLAPGARRNVDRLAAVLKQYPERRITVEGYTDSVGSEESNLALAQQRADAFAQALVNQGIGADRIQVRAMGEASPVADNSTAAGRQQNRRVEVLFSDAQGQFVTR